MKLDTESPEAMNTWRSSFDSVTGLPTRDQVSQVSATNTPYKGCFMLMDTQRENDISLGLTYPFAPLSVGECLINKNLGDALGVAPGETMYMKSSMTALMNNLISNYNKE